MRLPKYIHPSSLHIRPPSWHASDTQATDIRTQVNTELAQPDDRLSSLLDWLSGPGLGEQSRHIRASAVVLKVAGSLLTASERECEAAFQALKEEGVWCTENQRTLSGTAGVALNHLLELDNGWFRQTLTERSRSDSAREITVREVPYLNGCTFMVPGDVTVSSGEAGGRGQRTMNLNLFSDHTPVYDPVLCPALASEVVFGDTHGYGHVPLSGGTLTQHLPLIPEPAQAGRVLMDAVWDRDVATIRGLESYLLSLPPEQRVDVLNHARNGTTALLIAMQEGHADTVTAFSSLLTVLSPVQIVYVLNHFTNEGATPLLMAMQNGHADAVTAFGGLIAGWPLELQLEVLNRAGRDGITPLWMAMQNGFAGAVTAFGGLIAGWPLELQLEVLNRASDNGVTALWMAMARGHADAVTAFGGLIAGWPLELQLEVLNRTGRDGATALFIAMQEGHADAVTALGGLIAGCPLELQLEVLNRARDDGATPLFIAMQEGQAGTVAAFRRLTW